MTGARSRSWRFGDTDEKMAEAMLSLIAFTTNVAREDDIGHDFICVLAHRDQNLLRAGQSFAVQVKASSQRDEITFTKPHEVEWLEKQEVPFFICLANRERLRLDLYSTWNIHNSYLWRRANSYHLVPGGPDDNCELPFPRDEPECRVRQTIPLGRPALSFTMQDLLDEEKLENYRSILGEWIAFERQNIVRRDIKLHWIYGPVEYETNKSPFSPGTKRQASVYWNAVNLRDCLLNFTRASTSLRNTLHRALSHEEERGDQWKSKIDALEAVLKAYGDHLEDIAKQSLEEELGRALVAGNE